MIDMLLNAVMNAHDLILKAMETGVVDVSLIDDGPHQTPADGLSDIEKLQQLAEQAGGIDALEKLLGDGEAEAT